jgi:single-strand DNA-binding protein
MMLAAHGRLGGDPREIQTSTGKLMAVASIAVTLNDRSGNETTEWLGIVAFGRTAEVLLKHKRGELISVAGRCQRDDYAGRDGETRRSLQVVCDSVIGARSVRPGGRRKSEQPATSGAPAPDDFDDEIPL